MSLINTIKLGTQLFNPHRFLPVLQGLAKTNNIDPAIVSEYFRAANKCFEQKINIRLIGVCPVITSLQILFDKKISDSSGELVNVLLRSLFEFIHNDENKLVEAIVAAEKSEFSNPHFWHQISQKLDTVFFANIHNKIRVLHLVDNPQTFLGSIDSLHTLSELELSKLIRLSPWSSPMLLETLQVRLESVSPKTMVEKSNFLDLLLQIGIEHNSHTVSVMDVVLPLIEQHRDAVLSPTSAIDFCFLTGKKFEDIAWRIQRDPHWFKHLKPVHVIRLLEAINRMGPQDVAAVISALEIPISSQTFSIVNLAKLIAAFDKRWIEFESISTAIFQKVVAICEKEEEIQQLLSGFVTSVGISDRSLVDKLMRNRLVTVDLAPESGPGQLLFSKFLIGQRNIHCILDSLKQTNRIHLFQGLSELSLDDMIQLVSQLGPVRLLENLEVINEVLDKKGNVKLLELFAQHQFPSPKVVNSISVDSLDQLDFLSFIHSAALVRCVPEKKPVLNYLNSHDMRVLTIEQIACLIESLASLGIDPSVLVPSFFQSSNYRNASPQQLAHASGKILSSMFISLIVPDDETLRLLDENMKGHVIDPFYQSIIDDMRDRAQKEDDPSLIKKEYLYAGPGSHYFSHPTELTAIEKFKYFIKGYGGIRNWSDL